MPDWDDLTRELDRWAEAGTRAELWWRDDDATTWTPSLDRLVGLQRKFGEAVALAVIPARADDALAQHIARERDVVVVQHGWAHVNHARPGRAKAELGPDRPPAYVLGELARGQIRLGRLFGPGWLKVLVPPHNRIAPAVAAGLPQAGYVGLSTDKPRTQSPPGLCQINTHIDIMEWTVTRAFLGDGPCLDQALAHLAAKRGGTADPTEPTGLLTHHLAHDEASWRFVEHFLALTSRHNAVRWRHPGKLFQNKMAVPR